ncbi:MAG: beta-ketoacyl-[acyl-carrier-protein] synthase family protein [Thermoguttaceae bacterium]
MEPVQDVVVTGIGVVSPIGVGCEPFWNALLEGRGGIRAMETFHGSDLPPPLGAAVVEFDPSKFVRPRKNLKVMSRDIQLGVSAAELACTEAGLKSGAYDPDRVGVVYGADMIAAELPELVDAWRACMLDGRFEYSRWREAMGHIFPLWMLKYLPNMPGCHIAITQDVRGPNNSLTLAEVSGLAAIVEAAQVIQRGQADAMIAGGASSRLHPLVSLRFMARQMSRRYREPAAACRPFDAGRDGMIFGEGAAAFVLESGRHAAARGARILARILGFASAFEPHRMSEALHGDAIRQAMRSALAAAGVKSAEVGHLNAHGVSTTHDDQIEAQAIREVLGEVPVTAPKSYFGNLGAGTGAVEMAVSVLALQKGIVPPTLNYERPDPACPVHVICGQPMPVAHPTALVLNHNATGQSVALLLARE